MEGGLILVKEEFLNEDKTKRAIKMGGGDAILMWLAIKSYVARKNSGGFVPDEAIDDLQGAPKEPRESLKVLVECGMRKKSGEFGAGLVDPHPFGWMLHDYDDHGTPQEVEAERREKARLQKASRRAEQARLKALLSDSVRGHGPDSTPDKQADNVGQNGPDNAPDSMPDTPRPRAHTSAPARAPQPNPAQPEEDEAAAATAERIAEVNRDRFPMHLGWSPTPSVVSAIEIAGVAPWAIEELIGRFRVHFVSAPAETATESEWSQRCSKWALRDWRNPRTRPDKPADAPAAGDLGAYGKASEWA